jgi:hypothetical protein
MAARLARRVDRLRQLYTRFGLRSRRVFLVWTRFTGAARGEGDEVELHRAEILPTPRVSDTTSVSRNPFSAGVLPVGSVRVDQISEGCFTKDVLKGLRIPPLPSGEPFPDLPKPNIDFFYEVTEDGRGDDPDVRERFRLLGGPFRREGQFDFVVLLERASEDRTRTGQSQLGIDPDVFADALRREGLVLV